MFVTTLSRKVDLIKFEVSPNVKRESLSSSVATVVGGCFWWYDRLYQSLQQWTLRAAKRLRRRDPPPTKPTHSQWYETSCRSSPTRANPRHPASSRRSRRRTNRWVSTAVKFYWFRSFSSHSRHPSHRTSIARCFWYVRCSRKLESLDLMWVQPFLSVVRSQKKRFQKPKPQRAAHESVKECSCNDFAWASARREEKAVELNCLRVSPIDRCCYCPQSFALPKLTIEGDRCRT